MIRLVVRGRRETITAGSSPATWPQAARAQAEREVDGPGSWVRRPAPIAKLRGKYRFQLQVQGPTAQALRAAVAPGHRRA